MRLERVELTDFKCFSGLKLAFDKPINLIFGQNASGKTTISQAIELALTGRCNGSNMDFRTRSALTRNGAEEFTVSLTVARDRSRSTDTSLNSGHGSLEIIQKTDTKQFQPKPEQILELLKTNREFLASLFETRHFLDAHPDEQKKILFDLLDIKIDQSNLRQRLRKWMKDHPEVLGRYALPPNEDLLSCLGAIPKTLEEGYQEAFEERKLVKRELKLVVSGTNPSLNLPEDLPQNITMQELQNRVEERQRGLFGLHTQIGMTKGTTLGEKKQLEREISEISSDILRLQMEVKDFDSQREKAELAQMEQERESLGNEFQSSHEDLRAHQLKFTDLETAAKEEEKYLSRVKSFDGSCPFFEGLLEGKVACRTEEVLEAVRSINELSLTSEFTEEIKTTRNEIENLQKKIENRRRSLAALDGGISSRKSTIARLEANLEKIAKLRKKKEELEKVIGTLDDSKANEAEELRTKVKELETQIEKDKALLAQLQLAEKKRSLEDKLNKLEVLTLAFSPKGIMGDLLAGGISRLLTDANQLMQQISGGRYTIDITAEACPDPSRRNGFHIYLCDHHRKAKTEVSLASNSEQFRVGIVLQTVLSELAGLRFMLIDGVDILDQRNKGFFFRFLEMIAPRLDQVIAFCTIGQHYPKNPGLKDIDFWVIDACPEPSRRDGTVKRLPAIQA